LTAALDLAELRSIVGDDQVLDGSAIREYLHDDTEWRVPRGCAEAVVCPRDTDEVGEVMAWCYENGISITPQGGRTGYAGGAVPFGGIVISLGRLRDVRSFDPFLWRGEVEAGVTTEEVRRRARENGLLFPPDPGAAEQSQIGGNVATNAGGPHAFKYGATGAWVTGLEAVIPPGKTIRVGGLIRKDVAGYDLKSLLVGSEGTLGIVTAVSLRFIPAPEAALPVIAAYPDSRSGVEAIVSCLASGVVPAALEYVDADALDIVRSSYPGTLSADAGFVVIAEADGTPAEAELGRAALREVLAAGAVDLEEPVERGEIAALWRWRDGVGFAAAAALGAKVSEDIVVPIDHLAEAIEATAEIGARHEVRPCSWGHAGDGNLHSTFLFSPDDEHERERALAASEELMELGLRLGGSISGEHGVGLAKTAHLGEQLTDGALDLHRGVKGLFDPKGLLNPGKKAA
jgi:glycolate oxidase subunit GlcD